MRIRDLATPWKKRRRTLIYRYGYSPGLPLLIAGGFILLAVSTLLVLPLSLWHLLVVPFNLALAAFSWRMSRLGARIDEDGVKVVRMIRTIRIPWSQFRRFALHPRPRDFLAKTGYVERTDGSMVWIQGLAPWGRPITKGREDWAVEGLIEEMNRKARRVMQVAEPPASPRHR